MAEIIFDVLKNSVLITGLVIVMMIMIEYVNIQSKGKWLSKLDGSPFLQVMTASLLGLVPGCIGGFAAVSLYTHRLISFGALVAMMICSSGDEAFVMLAMIPKQALLLFAVLFVLAVLTGYAVDRIAGNRRMGASHRCDLSFDIHNGETLPSPLKRSSYAVLKHISAKRLFLLLFIGLFSAAILSGILEHDHSGHDHTGHAHTEFAVPADSDADGCTHQECAGVADAGHDHTHDALHEVAGEHAHTENPFSINLLNERWMNVLFAFLGILTLLLTLTANEHFVEHHLWEHIIKKHMLSIFLWTFGALLILNVGISYLDFETLIRNNMAVILVIAVLIGIIPESGPHMIFIGLFAGGLIPFSVLLANSIVQDGHTALPLLAENRKDFVLAKLINMLVGLAAGAVLMAFGL